MGNKNSSLVDEWRTEEGLFLLECYARDFSLTDVAEKIGINLSTLRHWRKRYPEIDKAVSKGKEVVDYQVENALLKVALGFTTTEVKTYVGYPDKNGNRKTRTETTVKEIAPNPTAIMCWLNNRKPDQWKRNRDNVLTTKDEDNKITVNIIQHKSNKEDDEEWTVDEPNTKSKVTKTSTSDSTNTKEKPAVKKSSDEDNSWMDGLTDEERAWLEEEE